uniref:Uncharacterized protein n=1 Tax=Vitis vinifera TaxID=29760 RepID=A5BC11_VITVI|nr:hypothetical protein VITISV_039897 [Vitis vinifera]
MCKFTSKKRSNKRRTVCIKVAIVGVEPRSVLETMQLVVVAIVHELLIMSTIRLNNKCKNKKANPIARFASFERKVRACLILVRQMEIPHEDQSSHYDHEKDKFAYLSMRDRIELGKRQVQQSQWGSKYALNGDDSYEHTVGECLTIPTMRDMYGYQSSYSSSWNNHPNLTTHPQPQPSMSTSSLEQAILKISKVMEDFVGEQQKINSHLNEKIDNMESSINLTNLDIARGKRKLPPQPHHNLQGTNAKRSRKVLKIDTLVGDCYDNSMDQPSIENHKVQDDKGLPEPFKASTSPGKRRETNSLGPNGKDANFVWDPGGIQHEGHIWSTFSSPFYTYYIPFRSLGSQKSNTSNGVQIGVETKKLWSLQENWTELSGNFAHLNPRCENSFAPCETPPGTRVPNFAHRFKPIFKHRAKQGAKISHTTIQGAKEFISRCENLKSKVRILFQTSVSHTTIQGVKIFVHRVKPSPGTRVPFCTPQATFHRTMAETRCELKVHIGIAHHNSRRLCKAERNVAAAPNFATVRHVFGEVPGVQIMHTIYRFKAYEVRNPVLQTVHDLDLNRRSYGRFKTDGAEPFQISESQESNGSNHVRFGAELRKIWPSEDNCIKLRDNFAHHCSRCEFLSPLCENFAHLKSTCEIGTPTCEFSPVSADSTRDLFF